MSPDKVVKDKEKKLSAMTAIFDGSRTTAYSFERGPFHPSLV
jgi:hypothetical protein